MAARKTNTETPTETKVRAERKPLPELDLTTIQAGRLDRADMAKVRPIKIGMRNATQQHYDEEVAEAYGAWAQAGRPDKWVDMPGMVNVVPAASEDVVKAYIRKAGNFHSVKIRFGRTLPHSDGYVTVSYVAIDRPVRETVVEDDGDDPFELIGENETILAEYANE